MNQMPAIPPRYEFKYLVDEQLVPALRSAIAPFCVPDRHSEASADRQYVITSLYLDTPDLAFHRAKVDRQLKRLKLRVRAYGGVSPSRVFLEVKRKHDRLVRKTRALLAHPDWAGLLGRDDDLQDVQGAGDFLAVKRAHAVRPTLLVRYRREAYLSVVDDYARVTLDRRLIYQSCDRFDLIGDEGSWAAQDDALATGLRVPGLVLELKATTRVPRWMTSMVRRLELVQTGFSKYCTGVERLWGACDLRRGFHRQAVWAPA